MRLRESVEFIKMAQRGIINTLVMEPHATRKAWMKLGPQQEVVVHWWH